MRINVTFIGIITALIPRPDAQRQGFVCEKKTAHQLPIAAQQKMKLDFLVGLGSTINPYPQ